MQEAVENSKENNVVSLFEKSRQSSESEQKDESKIEELSFSEVIRRNTENIERMKRERKKANQGVIRSYRLKR